MVSQCDRALTASGQGWMPKSTCGVCVVVGELLPVGVAVLWFDGAGVEPPGMQALTVMVSTSDKSKHAPAKGCLGCCSGGWFAIYVSLFEVTLRPIAVCMHFRGLQQGSQEENALDRNRPAS